MSENGEIYTASKKFTLPPAVTALTNLTSGYKPYISLNLFPVRKSKAYTNSLHLLSCKNACCLATCLFPAPDLVYARPIDQTLCVVWNTVGPKLEKHIKGKHSALILRAVWDTQTEDMSEVSLLIRKQEKKMTEVLGLIQILYY